MHDDLIWGSAADDGAPSCDSVLRGPTPEHTWRAIGDLVVLAVRGPASAVRQP